MAATPIPRNKTAKLPNFSRYKFDPPAGSVLKYKEGQGYYTAPKPKGTVVRAGTSQNRTIIETPAQIEQRVTRMANETYNRQKSDLDLEVEKMRKEAEGRRLGMIAAYASAGKDAEGLGSKVQAGWNLAGQNMAGLAGQATGSVADALARDTATQEDALSRVGAAGTGFDARSQAAVEAYRGGTLPAEQFFRTGGATNEFMLNSGINLRALGLENARVASLADNAKVDADRLSQIRKLGEDRVTYEGDLRKQLLGARADQIDAVAAAAKLLSDAQADKAKLKFQYWEARSKATTAAEKARIDSIYKNSMLEIKGRESEALVASRNAGARLADAKAQNLTDYPGGAGKPLSGSAQSVIEGRAAKVGNAAVQQVFANIWAKVAPSTSAPAGWKPKIEGQKYVDSPEYATKLAEATKWSTEQRQKSFGTIMLRTIKAIKGHLKPAGKTPAEIKRAAFDIVTARVAAPQWWLKQNPGFAPKVR